MNRTRQESCDCDGLVNMAWRISSDKLSQVLRSISVRHSWCVWVSFVPCLSSSSFSSSCSCLSPPLLSCLILNMPPGISRSCCPGRRYSGDGSVMEGVCACMCFLCGVWGNLSRTRGARGNFPHGFHMTHISGRATTIKQPYRFYIGLKWI